MMIDAFCFCRGRRGKAPAPVSTAQKRHFIDPRAWGGKGKPGAPKKAKQQVVGWRKVLQQPFVTIPLENRSGSSDGGGGGGGGSGGGGGGGSNGGGDGGQGAVGSASTSVTVRGGAGNGGAEQSSAELGASQAGQQSALWPHPRTKRDQMRCAVFAVRRCRLTS